MLDVYELYKPLRNRLRTHALMPGLLAVYRLIQFVQFRKSLPEALRYPGFGFRTPLQAGVFEWSLELIARELILNAGIQGSRALTTWNEYAEIANRVRDIENTIWGQLPNGPELIRYELIRVAHRQFPWQIHPSARLVASYFKLYSNARLDTLFRQTYEMSPREFYHIALSLAGHFIDHPLIRQPVTNRVNAVSPDVIARFLSRFALDLAQLRDRMRAQQAYNINWAYAFDPIRTWPIIDVGQDQLFCPMPTLLLWRLTEGVYFDLVQSADQFSRNFGPAFQDLVEDALRRAAARGQFEVLSERRYGSAKRPRDSVDVIAKDPSASVFVECKASRLRTQAKVDLNDTAAIDGELERLAGFVVQAYSTLNDALGGAYPHWHPNRRPVYPMVVTLDEWLTAGRGLIESLDASVRGGLAAKDLPADLLQRHPYTLCSLQELEQAAVAMAEYGIDEVMSRKTTGEHHLWAMFPFLQKCFPKSVDGRVLFEREWQGLTEGLGD